MIVERTDTKTADNPPGGGGCSLARSHRSKIKPLSELAETLESLRKQGKKIVHCHGVFDLMHIGHIRHFEEAKALGDILVVTVTQDKHVNKGSHRPVFKENLRAESVAALGAVDYVAVNQWAGAVETIALLKPDFYVKGKEYQDSGKDVTQGIVREENAVKASGGKLVFTDNITFSSSNLINRHYSPFTKEAAEYLKNFSSRHASDDILHYIKGCRNLNVLLVGEAIIDEYQFCEAIGKSSKEPMLAVRHLSTETFVGGILAVGNHVANFAKKTGLITVLGAQNSHEDFIREKLGGQIEPAFFYRKNAPTIVKRRYIENYFFTKLLEIYEMNELLDSEDDEMLCEALCSQVSNYDAVIVVDFGHGMLSEKAAKILSEKARFLAVNTQSNAGNLGYHAISKYPHADYICVAEGEMRLEARNRHGDLKGMVKNVSGRLSCDRVVATRGSNGCLTYGKGEGFFEVPAFAGQVIDRMGAGDAFLSVTALCAAQKAPMEMIGLIGNVVGAEAVATVGHRSSIEYVALMKHLESILK